MSDQTQVIEAPPRKRRKQKQQRAVSPFVGITNALCCNGCSATGCLLSGKPYCAHPKKGGLQSAELTDPEAIGRFNKAKKLLAHRAVDKRPT